MGSSTTAIRRSGEPELIPWLVAPFIAVFPITVTRLKIGNELWLTAKHSLNLPGHAGWTGLFDICIECGRVRFQVLKDGVHSLSSRLAIQAGLLCQQGY